MKRLIAPVAACAVVGALGVSGSAQAEQMSITPAAYLGADVMFWNFDPQGSSSAESEALRLRAGMQFNDYFAIEGHLATGGSDSIGGVDIDLDYLAGIFAKGFLPSPGNSGSMHCWVPVRFPSMTSLSTAMTVRAVSPAVSAQSLI